MAGIRDLVIRCIVPLAFGISSEVGYYRQRPGNPENFKMSAEEDTELRDMVAQTLESKGVLGKIRVRKRAILNILKWGL